MKVNEKNARGGKENLHSEPDKKLKNKRHRHMLLTISGIQKSEILMAVCTHGPVLKSRLSRFLGR